MGWVDESYKKMSTASSQICELEDFALMIDPARGNFQKMTCPDAFIPFEVGLVWHEV